MCSIYFEVCVFYLADTELRLADFKSRDNVFLLALSCSFPFCLIQCFSFSSFCRLVLCGWGLWTDRVSIALSRPCIADLF